jgi:hypothetical protein
MSILILLIILTIILYLKIIIIIIIITYTSVLPTLNNFKICLTDNYSHTQELVTFTPVLRSNTTLAFGDMVTTARLKLKCRHKAATK